MINQANPLNLDKSINIYDLKVNNQTGWGYGGYISSLTFSDDGELLSGASISGCCFIWDSSNWEVLQMLRDKEEKEIEEFYCSQFIGNGKYVATCGKRKSRSTWSEEDQDNFCLPGKIKIFDIYSGKVLFRMDGHTEEILCLKSLWFQGSEYLLSCGEDGQIIKWKFEDDYSAFTKTFIDDNSTHNACSLSFLNDCGNKFFIAGCDEGVKVYDFEKNLVCNNNNFIFIFVNINTLNLVSCIIF